MRKKIAVITSGGDAPGMNACVRAIVLAANRYGHQVIGFKHGYNGLIENEYKELFLAEAQEQFEELNRLGTVLEKHPNDSTTINNIFRLI